MRFLQGGERPGWSGYFIQFGVVTVRLEDIVADK